MQSLCRFMVFLAMMFGLMIGLLFGYVFTRIEDKLEDIHRDNLMILYKVNEDEGRYGE